MSEQPSKDESVAPVPPHLRKYEKQGSTAIQYGENRLLRGGQFSTDIFDKLLEYRRDRKSIVCAFTGEPGLGKTWAALRLAQMLDPKFNIVDPAPSDGRDPSQVVFGRAHLAYLTGADSPLKPGQVILIDEGHFDWGSRTFQVKEQRGSVNYIAGIRGKGLILFFVVLNLSMLDKILKEFIVTWEFAIQDRGEALAYNRKFYTFSSHSIPTRIGPVSLMVPDSRGCPSAGCLKCPDLHHKNPCLSLKAKYERRKRAFLDQQAQALLGGTQKMDDMRGKPITVQIETVLPYLWRVPEGQKGKMSRKKYALLYMEINGLDKPLGRNVAGEHCSYLEYKGLWPQAPPQKTP